MIVEYSVSSNYTLKEGEVSLASSVWAAAALRFAVPDHWLRQLASAASGREELLHCMSNVGACRSAMPTNWAASVRTFFLTIFCTNSCTDPAITGLSNRTPQTRALPSFSDPLPRLFRPSWSAWIQLIAIACNHSMSISR